MSNSGMGVGGSSNVHQHVVSADNIEKSESVGQKSFRKVSIVENANNTRGVIRTEVADKHNVKSPSLRDRLVQKVHQYGKTWVKFSDSQLGMFKHLTDSGLKKDLHDSIVSHNNLVSRLDSLVGEANDLENQVSQFEKDFSDILAFREKNHPGRSDFKLGKSFVCPDVGGKKFRITFSSPDKSARSEEVKKFHDSLRQNPDIKSCFDQHFQNKHDLAVCKEKMTEVKQKLYEVGEGMKPSLGKAVKQLYKDNEEILKGIHQNKESEIKAGFERQISDHEQGILNKRNERIENSDSQKVVSEQLRENVQKISDVDKKISESKSRLADFVIKQLRKIMPESQQAAYFNDSVTVEKKMEQLLEPLKNERKALQTETNALKSQEDALLKTEKTIKDDLWAHQANVRGANPLKHLVQKKLGVHIPVGRQTGGVIGALKASKKEDLALEQKGLKEKSAQAKRMRNADLRNLKTIAEGKALHGTDANYSRKSSKNPGERGILIVQNMMQNVYSGANENQWQAEILDIINDQDLESLDIIEKNIQGWGEANGSQQYHHVLAFIENNRRDSSL